MRWMWTIGLGLAAVASQAVGQVEAESPSRPNIVFMLADDQSWNGLGVAMHPEIAGSRSSGIDTPNIERLAREGVRCSRAYAPSPVCSPTRASLLTGRSPAALGWTKAGPSLRARDNPKLIPPTSARSLPAEDFTYAELLRQAGYATAHFGKWHVDGGGPERHGFDVSDGNLGNEAAPKFTDPNPVDIFGMAERADAFMERAHGAGKPFVLQLSWHALHAPQNALKTSIEKYEARGLRGRQAQRAALTEDLDTGVGRVLDAIDRLGIAGDTYVLYMTDNGGGGGTGRSGPLTGRKGTVFEGGIRVPLIVRGPGIEAGSWCDVPVIGQDLHPTFAEWAGIDELPARVREVVEGGSIASVLTGTSVRVERPREGIVFHFPHYQSGETPHAAIMVGEHKLIRFFETGEERLFDLSKDIGERNDLSSGLPARARELGRMLDAYLEEVEAALPTPNGAYDPSRPTETRDGRPGTGERPDRPRRRERGGAGGAG